MAVAREWQFHVYVADLLRLMGQPRLIWYHIPNEGKRSPRTGAFLKRLGMRAGAPDFALILPNGAPAFLELKKPKKYPDANQRSFRTDCEAIGVAYEIARTPEEARTILEEWGAIMPAVTGSVVRRDAA
jgi:hypothetical protein